MKNPYLLAGAAAPVVTWVAVVSSILLMRRLDRMSTPLKERTPCPPGILALEFCGSQTTANQLLADWQPTEPDEPGNSRDLIALARRSVYWDFPFIVAYSSAIALVCGYAAVGKSEDLTRLLLAFAWLQLAAAVLDVVENICMLIMLNAGRVSSSVIPFVTTISASVKFLFVGSGIMAGLVTLFLFHVLPRLSTSAEGG